VIARPTFPNRAGYRPIALHVAVDHRFENIACRIEIENFYRNSNLFSGKPLSELDWSLRVIEMPEFWRSGQAFPVHGDIREEAEPGVEGAENRSKSNPNIPLP
jgi:hypothetical protein